MATTEPRLLGGRYELGSVIGYGGMAEVFASRDTRLDREVAVKVLRADLARDPSFLSRFRREAQSAAGLNHPNIVAVYDTGEDTVDGIEHVPYIVMEYVAGRTLRDVLAEDGRLLPRRAMEIVAEVTSALEYSHRAGIVHRDIKPGNVMLTPTGEIKVMDFGIARAAAAASSTMTQTAQVLGTAQYLSPEQARGEHVDARSDIYSTGCLLYELLTGVPPFRGESAVAVAYQHVREDPLPPSQLDPDLPPSVDAVVLKAMAKNPANRYQDAAEMRADLERAAAGRRVEAPSVLAQDATTTLPAASPTTVLLRPDDDDRRGRRTAAYIALGIAVIAVMVIAALIAKGVFSDTTKSVHAPKVVGLSQAQAEQKIEGLGLKVGKVTPTPIGQDGNTLDKGLVYRQDPADGITVKEHGTINIFVSTGIQTVTVPSDLVGKTLDDAKAELAALHLTANVIQDNVPGTAGTVLSVPAAGQTVNAGTTIDLRVVSGSQQVPSVIGKSEADARQTLEAAGFDVAIDPDRQPDSSAPGTVVSQTPQGSQLNGTTITLTLSSGPPETTPPPTSPPPTTTPPTSTTPTTPVPPSA
ncbi:MAG TPA: Stk1 family PASTA domain-containing Ser/Thr kinase [Mycobacteriales bacterium]|nr:Stk1 family PASTA domain-containing Ser/Thr kinase [Mycobacteriales bacterium]